MKICISFIIIGLGIGWLAGLSLSPVISTIISALLALVASSMAFLTNLNFKKEDRAQVVDDWSNSIFFMALLMLGVVVGSSAGIYAREHNAFGLSLEKRAEVMRNLATENREKEREILETDIKFFKKIFDTHLEKNISKTMLQEYIQKKMLPLTSMVLPSTSSDELNSQYGKSGLYSDKKELCEFLLTQGSRVISLIEAKKDNEKYRDLIDLLNQFREEKLSDNEITTRIHQHLEEKCP